MRSEVVILSIRVWESHLSFLLRPDLLFVLHTRKTRTAFPSHPSSRQLSGSTLETVKQAMEARVPLDKLEERRKWREARLGALAVHKKAMEAKEN